MIQQDGLVNCPGVIVQAPGDGQVYGEILRRDAEARQILHHLRQLCQALVKDLISALVGGQRRQDLFIRAGDGHEAQDARGLLRMQLQIVLQNLADILRADLIQLIHRAHDIPRHGGKALHSIEAVQNLSVIHPDLESAQPQGAEGSADDGRDLRLVEDGELAVADDVNIRLVKFPEPAPLGPLAPVDLADLVPAEREGELVIVQRHIFGQRHRQVKTQRQVGVALGKAVDLLLRLAAALGQQHLRRFDQRRVQRGEAVEAVRLPQDLHHPFHLHLRPRQQLHKAG